MAKREVTPEAEDRRARAAAKAVGATLNARRLSAREMSLALAMIAAAVLMTIRQNKEAWMVDPNVTDEEATRLWLDQLRIAIEADIRFLELRDQEKAAAKAARKKH